MAGASVALAGTMAFASAIPASAATPDCSGGVCTVTLTNNDKEFTVPAGVASVDVSIAGTSGYGGQNPADGGPGGAFHFSYPVSFGDILRGGTGRDGGRLLPSLSYLGGGASALSSGDKLIAMAGGGGGSADGCRGGAGGTFGDTQSGGDGALMGDGTGAPATGGTSTTAGAGGVGTDYPGGPGDGPSTAQSAHMGGRPANPEDVALAHPGGGGGGGYYSGGAGGSAVGEGSWGCGAGGSGYLDGAATDAVNDAPHVGAGFIVITYREPDSGEVPAIDPALGAGSVAAAGVVGGGFLWLRRRRRSTNATG
ncbi:hypothetical protein [Leifsonia sp. C5G2]|uniref:hypothetical protein n=1 Tax=Leifsonia sp. C5G2 TaxID=2735269 RepID=UPI0015850959|nr:hypothetical protein [Leifsonia sp. C5G2]NUU05856.1 hypothetical protein [Leifsonia sp. C5G2]